MTPEDLKKIREAAEAATPGDLDTVNDPTDEHSDRSESDYYECPACQGQGEIDGVTYTNFDHVAIGVQFFGIGNEHVNYERFFRLLKPETVIQLVDEVEQARDWVNTVRRACREAMGNNSTFIDDDVSRTIERLTKELAEAREALGKIDPLTQYSSGNPEAQLFAVQQIIRAFRKIDKIAGDV